MSRHNFFDMLFCIKIFVLLFGMLPVKSDIHRDMSHDEIHRIFRRSDGSVPAYEIVDVEVSKPLESPNETLPDDNYYFVMRPFGQDIDMWLRPIDNLLIGYTTRIYNAKYSTNKPQNVTFKRKYGLMERLGEIYQNETTFTTLIIDTDESGRQRVDGYIGSIDTVLKPLPDHIVDKHLRRRRSDDNSYKPFACSNCHIAYKIDENITVRDVVGSVKNIENRTRVMNEPTKVLPDALYPEILAVVDHDKFPYQNDMPRSEVLDFLKYLVAFWNGVDLKYRSLTKPIVRFHISAIVFSQDERTTSYISENMITPTIFNSNLAIKNAMSFYYGVQDTFPIGSYDIVATMTRHYMQSDPNIVFPDLGAAQFRGACWVSPTRKLVRAVAIFNDNGAFSGIHNAAHELAHLLGANEDPRLPDCNFSYGYLMASPPIHTVHSSDFSKCSRISFHNNLIHNYLECLYNKPQEIGLPRLMPGRLKNLTAQCTAKRLGDPCHDDARICTRIHCLDDKGVCIETNVSALDGTMCRKPSNNGTTAINDYAFCLHMQCVTL